MANKRIQFFLLLALLGSATINAQTNKHWKPWLVPEAGILLGSYTLDRDVRLNAGVEKKGIMLGLGAAVDYYRFESYPVYFQARKAFDFRKVNLFVMSSWGYNVKSGTVAEPSWWGGRTITKKYSGGIYGEIGGGNMIRIRKKERLQVSVSWVMKAVEESFQSEIWNPVNQSPRTITNLNRYTMNRTALRIGWKF
jgi:hypothetical protein